MLYTKRSNEDEITVGGIGYLIGQANNITILKTDNILDRLARLTAIINGRRIGIIAAYAPTECNEDNNIKHSFFSHLRREV